MSKGEDRIVDLLNSVKIKYEREKRFKDLKHGLFRFDFYIANYKGKPAIIEYNGEQHYYFVSKFYKSRAEWTTAQGHDRRKISYCLANQIPIYIIPFWELPNVKCASDLFKDCYRAKSRWKNDEDFYTYTH